MLILYAYVLCLVNKGIKRYAREIYGKLVRVTYHTHRHTQTESKLNQMAFIYKQLYLFIVSYVSCTIYYHSSRGKNLEIENGIDGRWLRRQQKTSALFTSVRG